MSRKSIRIIAPLLLGVAACCVWAWLSHETVAQGQDSAEVAAVAQEGKTYVCPPCGCEEDDTTFDAPGVCPDCGMTLVSTDGVRNVAIVIWNGVELLDFAGPGEVFASSRGENGESFNVYTVARTRDPIVSQGFLTVQPEFAISDCPQPDIIVLPGGGTRNPRSDQVMLDWIKSSAEEAEIALTVCTGAFVLGDTGMLDNLEVTTWHGALDRLRNEFPTARVHDDKRFLDNGKVVTSAGVSAGIDSSLHVVTRLLGLETARRTAEYMEYDWRPERFGDAEPEESDAQVEVDQR